MPKKKKVSVDSKLQEKLDFIGLDFDKIPKSLKEYTDINFRTLKGYNEKKYRQYKFINVSDVEIFISHTNRMESIKEKYEKALPLCEFLDSKNEENMLRFTEFMNMLSKVNINQIEEVENEQKKLSKTIPFKVKFNGNYLWQIYYSEISDKYFMIVPIEDTDYSTFFYLLKKKIENKKQDKIFVPISLVDYSEEILGIEEIKEIENYIWLFTRDYPLIYEVIDKRGEISLNIIGETELYENIKTLYKIKLEDKKEAIKFFKLTKALFLLQTELPNYYKFDTNIDNDANLKFYFKNTKIEYENLPEFIMEQYLKSIELKRKLYNDIDELNEKYTILQSESETLEKEYIAKEKQITLFLECKKTFFGKVKYFFKLGKKNNNKTEDINQKEVKLKKDNKKSVDKFKLEARNYTLYELEESYKELEEKEKKAKELIMDINALKLKNKNLKRKLQNATNYIEEINKHKKSIFEFWKYSNKDVVEALDEGEEEEFNVTKIEKIFNYENEFENFGIQMDKNQRKKFTDAELDSCYIASTNLLELMNKIDLGTAENKEISEELKKLKESRILSEETDEEVFNIFGRLRSEGSKERTLGNKVHREQPRDKFEILSIKKGCKGLELKKNLEKTIENVKSAIKKNKIPENTYVYKASYEKLDFNTMESVSLSAENELEEFIKNDKIRNKIYLYKIKLNKGTNFIAFSNIIYFDNQNMTLPVGMNLSSKILIDLNDIKQKDISNVTEINKLQFEEDENDFSKILVKTIQINEIKMEEL